MRRKLLSAALLATMVVAAGCVGGLGSGVTQETGQETTAAGTTTAAATTGAAETVTPSEATLPPGVNESGVANASALAAAHAEALNGTGYSFVMATNVSMRFGNRTTLMNSTSNGTVEENATTFLLHSRSNRTMGNRTTVATSDVWGNETVILTRMQVDNRTRYRHLNRTGRYDRLVRAQLGGSRLVEVALASGNYTVESVERRDGRTLTTLVATEYAGNRSMLGDANVTTFESTIVVDGEGLVHSLNLTVATEDARGNAQYVHYRFELTEVGDVTVEEPAWTAAALDANTTRAGGVMTTQAGSTMGTETAENGTASGTTTAASG